MENTAQPDLQALALTKAIRQHESQGNYNAVGDNGTSTGAYQFQGATWKNYAKQILGDSNAQMSEANQNAVAYGMIKTWKEQGLGPAEIAAKWNSGNERGWENKVGTTTVGGKPLKYNVPAYVRGVVDNFHQIYPQVAQEFGTTQPEMPPQDDRSLIRKVGDFFTGGTQKFGQTIGESLAAPQNSKLFDEALQAHNDTAIKLQQAINKVKMQGGDSSRLEMALASHIDATPKLEDFTGNVINKSAEQVLGEGALSGLEALSGGLYESGAQTLGSKTLSLGQKLTQGARVGAGYGAVAGGANAMANNAGAGEFLGSVATGGAIGGGLGLGLEAVGAGVGKVVGKVLPETEASITRQLEARDKAVKDIAKSYERSLPLTPTERVKESKLLARSGDNVYTTLAKYGINVGKEEAVAQLDEISSKFETVINSAKDNEHAYFNLTDVRNNAFAKINSELSSATEREAARRKVDQEIASILKESPSLAIKTADGQTKVKSEIVERLRSTGNAWAEYNKLNPDSVKNAAGRGLADAVRDQVEKEGTFPSYREANREWSKIIHAQEVLQKLEQSGKDFRQLGGLSGSIARKTLFGALGLHSGGLGGLILSELGQEYLTKILSDPQIRNYFDRKLLEKLNGGKKLTPKAIAELEAEIKAFVDSHPGKYKELPSPSFMPMPEYKGGQSGIIKGQNPVDIQAAQKAAGAQIPQPKLLNAGNPSTVPGPTMRLGASSSIEPRAQSIGPGLKDNGAVRQTAIPKSLEPLAQEARKYKSAEEFVKAQPSYFRGEGGNDVAQGRALLAKGRHFAMDSEYPKRFGEVKEYAAKPGAKVFDARGMDFPEIREKLGLGKSSYISQEELTKHLKEQGYDIFRYDGTYKSTGKEFEHIVEITPDTLIPKSQLTDFYNKVMGKGNAGKASIGALGAGAVALGGLSLATKPSVTHYKAEPVAEVPKQNDIKKIKEAIAYNETRGENNPYTFSKFSGSRVMGDALGKYQVTEGVLKTYAKKVMGRDITRKEFLSSPDLQEVFMDKYLAHMKKLGLNTEKILAGHRGGFSNLDKMDDTVKRYQAYVNAGMKYLRGELK